MNDKYDDNNGVDDNDTKHHCLKMQEQDDYRMHHIAFGLYCFFEQLPFPS